MDGLSSFCSSVSKNVTFNVSKIPYKRTKGCMSLQCVVYFNRNCVTLRATGLHLHQLLEYQKRNVWLWKRFSSPFLLCSSLWRNQFHYSWRCHLRLCQCSAKSRGFQTIFTPLFFRYCRKNPKQPQKTTPELGAFFCLFMQYHNHLKQRWGAMGTGRNSNVVSTSCTNNELQCWKLLSLHSANTFKNKWGLSLL